MARALLSIVGSAAGTFWLCALLTWPHRPRASDEVDALVYRRFVGQRQSLMLLALLATALLCLLLFVR